MRKRGMLQLAAVAVGTVAVLTACGGGAKETEKAPAQGEETTAQAQGEDSGGCHRAENFMVGQ